MIDLAEHIKEQFADGDLTTLHMFRNGDKWHCNVTHRETNTWGATDSVDPVKAITKAIEICVLGRNGSRRAGKPLPKTNGDDLL